MSTNASSIVKPAPEVPVDLITTATAARRVGVHPATIYRWILTGRLPGWKLRGRYRISARDLDALLVPVEKPAAVVSAEQEELSRRAASAETMRILREGGFRFAQ